MTGNFNVPGARMPQEVEAGETKFFRKMIFQIHSFFFFCVVPGSWNVQVTIANRRTNRWTRRNEQNWFRVPCCGVSLEGIRQPLGASCVAGRFIRRPQNQSQHTPWSPCVIVQFDRPLRQLSPAMKKRRQMSKNSIKPLLLFFMANCRGNVRFLCVDLTESSLKLIFK